MFSIIIIFLSVLAVAIYFYTKRIHKKYSQNEKMEMTGEQVARNVLKEYNLEEIQVKKEGEGHGGSYVHVDRCVYLKKETFDAKTLTSTVLSCHECGHAIQREKWSVFFKIRSFIFYLSRFSILLLIPTYIIGFSEKQRGWFYLADIFLILILLHQLLTLPVEWDANQNAKRALFKMKTFNEKEKGAINQILRAGFFTYLVSSALLASLFLFLITNLL